MKFQGWIFTYMFFFKVQEALYSKPEEWANYDQTNLSKQWRLVEEKFKVVL